MDIDVHPLHGNKELEQNLDAVNALLQHDKKAKIKLLPIIEQKDKAIKGNFYSKEYLKKFPTRNADILYNGKVAEIKVSNGGTASIQNCFRGGKKQSNFVIIQVPDSTDMDKAYRTVNGKMTHAKKKEEDLTVWLLNNDTKFEFVTKQKGQ